MTSAEKIKSIEITDAGDGSTSVEIKFFDGSEHYVNADTNPEASALSARAEPGQPMSYPELQWDANEEDE